MDYALTTLNLRPGMLGPALAKLGPTLQGASSGGALLGCFVAEIGVLNRVLILRSCDSIAAMMEENNALLAGGDFLGLGELLVNAQMRCFRPFPNLEPVRPGSFGPFYEVREYAIKPGGMATILDVWGKALPPRNKYSPNLVTMYALDGSDVPGFIHIWPYRSLDERASIRAKTVAEGIWPPKGTGEQLISQSSEIFIPAPFSPLQ